MKILEFTKRHKVTSLFLMILFFFNQEGISQKNTLKVTPLKFFHSKMNLSYERELTQKWSIVFDTQRWFIKDQQKDQFLGINTNSTTDTESNKGTRLSLEFRTYSLRKKRSNTKRNIYFGFGSFLGKHQISIVNGSYTCKVYVEGTGGFGQPILGDGSYGKNVYVPEVRGEVDLISGGLFVNSGIQYVFWEKFKLEIGLISGRAWTNQENNFLTLSETGPYVLEEERHRVKEEFTKGIQGFFFQPMLNIGFSF